MDNEGIKKLLDNVPQELKERNQWVLRKGKIPYSCNGTKASSTNPETWMSFEQMISILKEDKDYDGAGFVFTLDSGYCGIDFDKIIDEEGKINPDALEIIREIDSYTEYSPSHKGVHIICKCPLHTEFSNNVRDVFGKNTGAEIYWEKRYFTVTGDVFNE